MEGKLAIGLLTLLVPAALVGITIARFAANPLALLAEIATMVGGALYLLTYTEWT